MNAPRIRIGPGIGGGEVGLNQKRAFASVMKLKLLTISLAIVLAGQLHAETLDGKEVRKAIP
jgi:hypothetical protein